MKPKSKNKKPKNFKVEIPYSLYYENALKNIVFEIQIDESKTPKSIDINTNCETLKTVVDILSKPIDTKVTLENSGDKPNLEQLIKILKEKLREQCTNNLLNPDEGETNEKN